MSPFFRWSRPLNLAVYVWHKVHSWTEQCLQPEEFGPVLSKQHWSNDWQIAVSRDNRKLWEVFYLICCWMSISRLITSPWVFLKPRTTCLGVRVIPWGAPRMRGWLLIFWMNRFSQVLSSSSSILTWFRPLMLVMLGQGNPELYGGELEVQGRIFFLF